MLICRWGFLCLAAVSLGQEVTLTLDRFEALKRRAQPPTQTYDLPAVLERIDVEVRILDRVALLTQVWDVRVFSEGWQEIRWTGDIRIIDLEVPDGLDARIANDVQPYEHALYLRGSGRHRLVITTTVPFTEDDQGRLLRAFSWYPARAGAITGRFVGLDPGRLIRLRRGMLLDREAETHTFLCEPIDGLSVSWRDEAGQGQREVKPIVTATSATAAGIDRDRIEAVAAITWRIEQGALREVALDLPAHFTLTSVSMSRPGNHRRRGDRLEIVFVEPVTERVRVDLVLKAARSEVDRVPVVGVRDVLALETYAGIRAVDDSLLQVSDPGASRPLLSSYALPDPLTRFEGRLFAVDDPTRPPRVEMVWGSRTATLAAQVDRLLVRVVIGEDGRAYYRFWAQVRNRGLPRLEIAVPEGFQAIRVTADGVEVRPSRLSGSGAVICPAMAGDGTVVYAIEGVLPLELPADGVELKVPLPAFNAPVNLVDVMLGLPGDRSYELVTDAREIEDDYTPDIAHNPVDDALVGLLGLVQPNAHDDEPEWVTSDDAVELDASWVAMAADPGTLILRTRRESKRRSWQ